ncbi:hypothetical protein OIU34_20280 [Pararhizobium sp. BT-229]|uniref:hypothetical protein n=1 Tax=Pararhizobium sp. BT-229 TaxID=2986923 RepID=UPI0021F76D44|nr:hypothetical protein [Pararhizobium sp. BT-229]MCV9964226.1 hypothetical protein [Pararhizobium sp. BT-229]
MRLTIPFLHTGEQCDVGRMTMIDKMQVVIADVAESEAPKVMSYCDTSGGSILMRGLRLHEGRFYAPFLSPKGKATPRKATSLKQRLTGSAPPTEMIHYLDVNGAYGKAGKAEKADLAAWYTKPLDEKDLRTGGELANGPKHCVGVQSSNKHLAIDHVEARQSVLNAAAGLLLVDGWLHFEAREPFIAVSSMGQTSIRNDFDMRPDPHRFLNISDDIARFSVVDSERAEAFAAAAVPDRGPAAQRYEQLSVFDEGAFPFDAAASLATRIAYHLIANTRQDVGNMRNDHVECWLNLRDELDRAVEGNADAERIAEAAVAFIDQGVGKGCYVGLERKLGWLSSMLSDRSRVASAGPTPAVRL